MTYKPNTAGGYDLTRKSVLTQREHTLHIPKLTKEKLPLLSEELRHAEDLLIQDAFPELTPDEREFILTGITSEEWKHFNA